MTSKKRGLYQRWRVLWRVNNMLGNRHHAHARTELRQKAVMYLGWIRNLTVERLEELWLYVMGAINERYRVSSLIECINSVIRPILAVRKHVSRGALALFAAWWNLNPRTTGPLKGTCPYTVLTGREVKDWLSELGFPPGHYMN